MKNLGKLKEWAKEKVDDAVSECFARDADQIWHREYKAEIDAAESEEEVYGIVERLDMDLFDRIREAEMREDECYR